MKYVRYLFTIVLLFVGLNSFSQTELTSKLLNKEWVIKSYEINGKYYRAKDVDKEGYVIFGNDSVKTVKKDVVQNSKWKYDAARKYLSLYSDSNHEKSEMKVVVITDKQLVWETTNAKGERIKVFMFAKE
ncbi:MAG: hypothetical protein JWQ25_2257 [Daejeonella sp.]|nr:hypothetical protein [Daejeonella sp.]